MRLIIIVPRAAMSKIEEPDNPYLWISEKPAWKVLNQWFLISADFAHYSFRDACGFSAHPDENTFKKWVASKSFKLSELFPRINKDVVHPLDLSVSSKWMGHEKEFNNLDYFQYKIDQVQKNEPDKLIAGGYLEPRSIYTTNTYDRIGNNGTERRSIHLGIDYWLPAETAVHAILDGEVVLAVNDAGNKEYGGLVILKHQIDGWLFYTLYGHLSVASATKNKRGQQLKKGDKIGVLGNTTENGNWAPHLHFQVLLSLLDYEVDFPGVAYFSEITVWKSICPDPNVLFKS